MRKQLQQIVIILCLFAVPATSYAGFERAPEESKPLEPSEKGYDPMGGRGSTTSGTTSTTNETAVTDRIEELARALDNDPLKLFNFVKNEIEYQPGRGIYTGADGCLRIGKGNGWDQCALLISLLRESGITCKYVTEDVAYKRETLANWIGGTTNTAATIMLDSSMRAGNISWDDEKAFVRRLWVEAEIDSSWKVFDPAFEEFEITTPVDWRTAAGYDKDDFLQAVTSGATVTANYVEDLNEDNLSDELLDYSMTLADYLRTNCSGKTADEALFGREKLRDDATTLPTELPGIEYTWSSSRDEFDHIAASNILEITIEHHGIDESFKAYEFFGKPITMVYNGTQNYRPELYLDGTLTAYGNAGNTNNEYELILECIQPTRTAGRWDAAETIDLVCGARYNIIAQFMSKISWSLINEETDQLAELFSSGLSDDNTEVFGISMWLYELNYYLQECHFSALQGWAVNTITRNPHLLGVCGEENGGLLIDLPSNMYGSTATDGNSTNEDICFLSGASFGSALEHGVIEQQQEIKAVSTTRLLTLNNRYGMKTFFTKNSNWNVIEPQLTNYPSWLIDRIEDDLPNGYEYVLPEDAYITLLDWTGIGYVRHDVAGSGIIGMKISGGYNGGHSAEETDNDSEKVYQNSFEENLYSGNTEETVGGEPVDLFTGNFVSDREDIAIGQNLPAGISLARHYSSGRNNIKKSLGYGWNHNLDIRVSKQSKYESAFGQAVPEHAAAQMVQAFATVDLMKGDDGALGWTTVSLVADWAMEQLTENAATVVLGDRTFQFIRMPDGSYNLPAGTTAELTLREPESFGYSGTDAVSGDYDGDGIADLAVYDTTTFTWHIMGSSAGYMTNQFGNANTIPVPGDYDGDGTNDIAVMNTSTFLWSIIASTDGFITTNFGYSGTIPVQADYDGDGATDIAVMDTSSHDWHILASSNGYWTTQYGYGSTTPVPADYDGDGATEIAVVDMGMNPYRWYLRGIGTKDFGSPGTTPVPADYDGDGTDDVAVFDSGSDELSFAGSLLGNRTRSLGHDGSQLLTGDYDGDGDCELAAYQPSGGRWCIEGLHDGLFHLQERNGRLFTFNKNNTADRVTDPDGNENTFLYSGANLYAVKDRYERNLIFSYTGNLLTSVSDSSGRSISYQYDGNDNLTNHVDAEGHSWGISYDSDHRITALTDPEGITTIQNAYNSLGQVTNQISPTGNSWDYLIAGSRAFEEDPHGNRITHYFDDDGRNTATENQLTNRNSRCYDGQGRLIREINEHGVTNIPAYDSNHNLLSITEAAGTANERETDFSYDSLHQLTNATVAGIASTAYGYNEEHHPVRVTDPEGTTAATTYTDAGLPLSVTSATYSAEFTYDLYGHLDTVTSSDAGTIDYDFNSLGDLTQLEDALGNVTTYIYDDNRRLLSTTFADGSSVSNTYFDNGLLESTTDGRGNTTEYAWNNAYKLSTITYPNDGTISNIYDSLDRLIGTKDARGETTWFDLDPAGRVTNLHNSVVNQVYTYDETGRLILSKDSEGANMIMLYDVLNRMVSHTNRLGYTESYIYSPLNNLTNLTDKAGKTKRFEYDLLGRRTKSIRPSGAEENSQYNQLGFLIKFENADGKAITFGHDSQGRITSTTNALGNVTQFSYSSNGLLTNRIDAMNSSSTYSYDTRNRLEEITYPDSSTASFDYDAAGNPLTATNNNASLDFAHDSMNRLTATTQSVFSASSVVQYSRDLNGSVTNIVYPGNKNVGYSYDEVNRLTGIDLSDFGITNDVQYTYDSENRLTGITYPNGVTAAFTPDAEGRLTAYTCNNGSDFIERAISRNPIGFKSNECVNAGLAPEPAETQVADREYNDADQLTSQTIQQGTNSTTITYTYSDNGCLTNSTGQGGVEYTWNYDNRLTSIENGSTNISYIYDAQGSRVARIENGLTNTYILNYADPLKRPLCVLDADGDVERYYIWGNAGIICHVESNGTVRYYHTDEQGSTLALTDENGSITDQFAYMPYGHYVRTGTTQTPFKWIGGYGVQDEGNGLYFMLNRHYSTQTRQWLSADPIGLAGGANLYTYANLNPVAFFDPKGLAYFYTGGNIGGGDGFSMNVAHGVMYNSAVNSITAGPNEFGDPGYGIYDFSFDSTAFFGTCAYGSVAGVGGYYGYNLLFAGTVTELWYAYPATMSTLANAAPYVIPPAAWVANDLFNQSQPSYIRTGREIIRRIFDYVTSSQSLQHQSNEPIK